MTEQLQIESQSIVFITTKTEAQAQTRNEQVTTIGGEVESIANSSQPSLGIESLANADQSLSQIPINTSHFSKKPLT